MGGSFEIDDDAPVFAIAVAAELAGMHPQTLRQYDRIGLVIPGRTRGGSRRYSARDVEQLREIARLSSEGMSLVGIARVLDLEDEVRALRLRCRDLEIALQTERAARPGARVFAAGATGSVVTLRAGTRVRRSAEIVLWTPPPPDIDDPPGDASHDEPPPAPPTAPPTDGEHLR